MEETFETLRDYNPENISAGELLLEPEIIESDSGSNWFETGVNSAIGTIDKISKIPQILVDVGTRANEEFIEAGRRIQGAGERIATEGGSRARQNLTSGKIDSFFVGVSRWLQRGNNIWYVAAALLAIILFRR